jgi:hypothetical protein
MNMVSCLRKSGMLAMLYVLLCFNDEKAVYSWTKEQDDAVMARLDTVHQKLVKKNKFGPAARLMPTTTATTVMKNSDPPVVVDGPYAETKEQLLGFYVIDCDTREEAVAFAQDLARANPGGAYEIRPVRLFLPGTGLKDAEGPA